MFNLNKCSVKSCNNIAFSQIDGKGKISEEHDYCLSHSPTPRKEQENITKYIVANKTITGVNAQGMIFYDVDMGGKSFFGCDFMRCTFNNFHLHDCRFIMCMVDFSIFTNCSFLKCSFKFSSFGGATFSHCIFTDDEVIQDNFNGVNAFQSSFDNSDLYNSRFMYTNFVDMSFRNCNLKKANFSFMKQKNISFKISNTREAIFDANTLADQTVQGNIALPY